MSMTPAEKRLSGQIAVYQSWANTSDPTARTEPARKAFDDRFVKEVDPTLSLPPEERARRVQAARKAYFSRLALRSAQARRRRAAR